MMRPNLGPLAFNASLLRSLTLDETGRLLTDENPDDWALIDEVQAKLVHVADLRICLVSASLDERRVRAVVDVEGFPVNSPFGPTQPRMGDLMAVEIAVGMHLGYEVALTRGEVEAGVDEDLGEGELLLTLHGFWVNPR